MAEAKTTSTQGKKNNWENMVGKMRENYLNLVKSLQSMQEETEKVINSVIKKGSTYQEESVKIIKEWIESGNKIKDEFKSTFEDNLKKSMNLLPDLKNMDFPFKKELEEISGKVQEQLKKAFEMFKVK